MVKRKPGQKGSGEGTVLVCDPSYLLKVSVLFAVLAKRPKVEMTEGDEREPPIDAATKKKIAKRKSARKRREIQRKKMKIAPRRTTILAAKLNKVIAQLLESREEIGTMRKEMEKLKKKLNRKFGKEGKSTLCSPTFRRDEVPRAYRCVIALRATLPYYCSCCTKK